MIFYEFYSNFSLHDSLVNSVSEHLKCLKYQQFSGAFPPNPKRGGGLTVPHQPTQSYCMLPLAVRK